MAIDTRQKRMTVMNVSNPWRGPMVDVTEWFSIESAAAVSFMFYRAMDISETVAVKVWGAGAIGTVIGGSAAATIVGAGTVGTTDGGSAAEKVSGGSETGTLRILS